MNVDSFRTMYLAELQELRSVEVSLLKACPVWPTRQATPNSSRHFGCTLTRRARSNPVSMRSCVGTAQTRAGMLIKPCRRC